MGRAAAARRGLVVGNYCHDVIHCEGAVVAESLGGASSFVSNILDGLNLCSSYVAKVGPDFAYPVAHPPLVSPAAPTAVFHAHFDSRADRLLRRVRTCDGIAPADLPAWGDRFAFGLVVGVAGEIPPETLARMADLCRLVFVDAQALLREFNPADGTVRLVNLKDSGFAHLLPRIDFLKASAEEAPFVDVDEARKWCIVLVTDGDEGCRVYTKDLELRIPPFPTVQVDLTGAGDSFLAGLVAGLIRGLPLPDAALLGNFFGSLTVSQIGVPKFKSTMFQRVEEEVDRRKLRNGEEIIELDSKPLYFSKFYFSLVEAARLQSFNDNDLDGDLESSKIPHLMELDKHHHGQEPVHIVSSSEANLSGHHNHELGVGHQLR